MGLNICSASKDGCCVQSSGWTLISNLERWLIPRFVAETPERHSGVALKVNEKRIEWRAWKHYTFIDSVNLSSEWLWWGWPTKSTPSEIKHSIDQAWAVDPPAYISCEWHQILQMRFHTCSTSHAVWNRDRLIRVEALHIEETLSWGWRFTRDHRLWWYPRSCCPLMER